MATGLKDAVCAAVVVCQTQCGASQLQPQTTNYVNECNETGRSEAAQKGALKRIGLQQHEGPYTDQDGAKVINGRDVGAPES